MITKHEKYAKNLCSLPAKRLQKGHSSLYKKKFVQEKNEYVEMFLGETMLPGFYLVGNLPKARLF